MSLFIASLNSGSNGNCYYIGNESEGVLIDAGISCRETEKRMKRLGLSPRKLKAIFVTHEHGDHIHGVPNISKKFQLPVYITPGTLQNTNFKIEQHLIRTFQAYEKITIGELTVIPFPKTHDAQDPHSFVVANDRVRVGVFTDIGMLCEHVTTQFSQCHAAFLESNYDVDMLENGRYPFALKNRIRNGQGHLSNAQAAALFADYRPPFMSHLILAHLSRNNNRPKLVEDTFQKIAGNTTIVVASRDKESRLFHIRDVMPVSRARWQTAADDQLSLF